MAALKSFCISVETEGRDLGPPQRDGTSIMLSTSRLINRSQRIDLSNDRRRWATPLRFPGLQVRLSVRPFAVVILGCLAAVALLPSRALAQVARIPLGESTKAVWIANATFSITN